MLQPILKKIGENVISERLGREPTICKTYQDKGLKFREEELSTSKALYSVVTVTSNTLLGHFHLKISRPLRLFEDHVDLYMFFGSEIISELKQHVTFWTSGIR